MYSNKAINVYIKERTQNNAQVFALAYASGRLITRSVQEYKRDTKPAYWLLGYALNYLANNKYMKDRHITLLTVDSSLLKAFSDIKVWGDNDWPVSKLTRHEQDDNIARHVNLAIPKDVASDKAEMNAIRAIYKYTEVFSTGVSINTCQESEPTMTALSKFIDNRLNRLLNDAPQKPAKRPVTNSELPTNLVKDADDATPVAPQKHQISKSRPKLVDAGLRIPEKLRTEFKGLCFINNDDPNDEACKIIRQYIHDKVKPDEPKQSHRTRQGRDAALAPKLSAHAARHHKKIRTKMRSNDKDGVPLVYVILLKYNIKTMASATVYALLHKQIPASYKEQVSTLKYSYMGNSIRTVLTNFLRGQHKSLPVNITRNYALSLIKDFRRTVFKAIATYRIGNSTQAKVAKSFGLNTGVLSFSMRSNKIMAKYHRVKGVQSEEPKSVPLC